jgi:signal transduction histidine kinase
MGDIGYYGYYTYVNLLRQQVSTAAGVPFELIEPAPDSPTARASRLAQYVFFYDADADTLNIADEQEADGAIASHLTSFAREFLNGPVPDTGFSISHAVIDGAAHTYIVTRGDDENRALGFAVNRQELGTWLRQSFDKGTLLPQSLAGGAITNDYVYLQFADHGEIALFETGNVYDPTLKVSRSLQDEYNGIFEAHTISASIDPAIAESLVIGGLPRSRLPLLIVVLVMTVGLLVAAIRQLQRERSIIRMRTNFVSEVSHELRTPLTQIRMFAETLLLDRVRSENDRRRALEIINREAQRLIHLVENVLQFSNGRNKKRVLQVEKQPLQSIVERVIDEFDLLSAQARAKVACHFDENVVANVDADAVRQILVNLLDNAVKYGPADQMIRVELTQHSAKIRLAVTDEGPGIPHEERERIWGGYYRLNRERSSAIAGTGIGLAVVRELAALQGGRSWVESNEGGGACFVVELPSARQKQKPPVGSTAAGTAPPAGESG